MEVAREAALAGGLAALKHHRADFEVLRKADNTPVTIADTESEAAILTAIRSTFPDHQLLTEEGGVHASDSPYRWIVDPLDGTRGFIRGSAFWGPLVALEHEGEILAGAMGMPVLEEIYFAGRGLGAFRNQVRLQVSAVNSWSNAVLSVGEMNHVFAEPHGGAVQMLIASAYSARCYGDAAGCAMVLNGQADAWIEAGVHAWDIAPFAILLSEAGGRFTDFAGADTVESGNAVCTNGRLHDHVLEALGS